MASPAFRTSSPTRSIAASPSPYTNSPFSRESPACEQTPNELFTAEFRGAPGNYKPGKFSLFGAGKFGKEGLVDVKEAVEYAQNNPTKRTAKSLQAMGLEGATLEFVRLLSDDPFDPSVTKSPALQLLRDHHIKFQESNSAFLQAKVQELFKNFCQVILKNSNNVHMSRYEINYPEGAIELITLFGSEFIGYENIKACFVQSGLHKKFSARPNLPRELIHKLASDTFCLKLIKLCGVDLIGVDNIRQLFSHTIREQKENGFIATNLQRELFDNYIDQLSLELLRESYEDYPHSEIGMRIAQHLQSNSLSLN